MEKIIVSMICTAFKIVLRYWTKNSNILTSNLTDTIQFAENCGLTFLEAKKFNRTIEDFADAIAEDFIDEFITQIENEERKDAILHQIQEDIQKVNLCENKLISEIHNSGELQAMIMAQSEQERKLWSESEVGIYTNCIKYISKMGMNFVSKFPSFSSNALKVIIQRQEEYYQELKKILMDIRSMTNLIKSTEVKYSEYESIYREKIIEKYGKVELIGSKLQDRHVRRYDITSAYVELNCVDNELMTEVALSRVFESGNIIWIKGEAGAGKTTFLQWIAICSAKGEYGEIGNTENIIPIVIELRNVQWPFNLHKYLAVKTICRNCEWEVLIKEACNVNWRETIIMCFREMGNNNVKYILEELVDKGKKELDDRYLLMASLCASNAQFFYAPIKEEIDKKIKEMIPPTNEKIEEMTALGSYLLAFLKNTDDYSYEEKYNCLRLLSNLKMKEAIPVILTYIKPDSYIYIYQLAAELLCQYTAMELEEYSVKEYLLKVMVDSIYDNILFTCEAVLYILNNAIPSTRELESLSSITKVIVFGQDSLPTERCTTDLGKYFRQCKTLEIMNNFKSLTFLKNFMYIQTLSIKSESRFSMLTYELTKIKNLDSVISLHIDTNQWEIYLINRVKESMKNLQEIEISLRNKNLRLNSDTFEGFYQLNRVIFNVNSSLATDIKREWNKLVWENDNIEIITNILAE